MKDTYKYTISSTLIWTSFDFGEVEANSVEEAKEIAIEELTYNFKKANLALATLDNTIGFTIEFNKDEVQVELKSINKNE